MNQNKEETTSKMILKALMIPSFLGQKQKCLSYYINCVLQ